MKPDDEVSSFSWQVYLAKFIPAQSALLQAAVGKFTCLKGRPSHGVWIRSKELMTATVLKRVDPRLSTLSLVNGFTFEHHQISRVLLYHASSKAPQQPQAFPGSGTSSRNVLAFYATKSSPSQ
eukprot:TRINITY_DN21892_c0_g2_i1.p1 TRINITY_DN21892_c0_g2~~TRINITY_DN21892_c0_g2_i1.p1  ORF type:complete len:123 (+),score=11.50 TRINITY_DN21892_c0_g2_i1:103-471(+)